MDKQVFDDAIGEVPPSTIDVDAVIVRGRRAARLRRVANPAVAAGVAVVLLTGAVAYTMTRGQDGGATVGTAPPTSSTTTSQSSVPPASEEPWVKSPDAPGSEVPVQPPVTMPPQCEEEDQETASVAAARLTLAATKAVSKQRPDVKLVANSWGQTPHGPLEFYQARQREPGVEMPVCDPAGQFEAMATTQAPEGAGNILFVVSPNWYPDDEMSCGRMALPNFACDVATGPGGEKIVKQTGEFERGTISHRVEVLRPDGTSLLVDAENVATTTKLGGPPTATAPPLTLDQMVAIAIDPDLGMFP